MVAVISEAVVIRVQLGAVGDVWTVVSAVLVTVTVPAGRRQVSDSVCVTLLCFCRFVSPPLSLHLQPSALPHYSQIVL